MSLASFFLHPYGQSAIGVGYRGMTGGVSEEVCGFLKGLRKRQQALSRFLISRDITDRMKAAQFRYTLPLVCGSNLSPTHEGVKD